MAHESAVMSKPRVAFQRPGLFYCLVFPYCRLIIFLARLMALLLLRKLYIALSVFCAPTRLICSYLS